MKTFVCDVDGVLADFVLGFTNQANKLFPDVPVYGALQQKTWNGFAGMSPEQVALTWKVVRDSPVFWANLPDLVSEETWELIRRLNIKADVYFATSRVGNDTLFQTKSWLEKRGVFRPNVVVTARKGEFCRVVSATGAIDDKPDNVNAIAWMSERHQGYTVPFLLSRPYNIYDDTIIGSKSVRRVGSVKEYLEWCFKHIDAS